jgi:hypothetical protein
MIVINSKEFRSNQKKYFDLVDKNERVIIQRGKDKAYELTRNIKNDRYFDDPKVIEHILEGVREHKDGKSVEMTREEIRKLMGL